MFREEMKAAGDAAAAKRALLDASPAAYLISAILAGVYIGFGSIVMGSCAGAFEGGVRRIVGAAVFPAALSMVIMAGSELFTGNAFTMTAGVLVGSVRTRDLARVWAWSYAGNLIGSLALSAIFCASGLLSGSTAGFFAGAAAAKTSAPAHELFARGVLCNILVCVAVWSCTKMKSESGKLVMIFWCVFTFVASGFEHSIANMTTIAIGAMTEGSAVTLSSAAWSLAAVTAGNIVGGSLAVALPYWIISKR